MDPYLPQVQDVLTNTPIESADLWLPNLPKLENVHPDGRTPFLSISRLSKQTNRAVRWAALPRSMQEILFICLEERNVKGQKNLSSRSTRGQTAALSLLGPRGEESVPNVDVYALYCADVDFTAFFFFFYLPECWESCEGRSKPGGFKLTSTYNQGAFS